MLIVKRRTGIVQPKTEDLQHRVSGGHRGKIEVIRLPGTHGTPGQAGYGRDKKQRQNRRKVGGHTARS